MEFLCIVGRIETTNPAQFTPDQMVNDWNFIRRIYARGVIRQIWSRGGVNGGVMLVEADSVEEAEGHVIDLPLMKKGLLRVESTYALAPYKGFANLATQA